MTLATFAAAQVLRVVPRVRLSQAVGRLCEVAVPEPLGRIATSLYARAYRVNLDEAERDAGGYGSFDEFFTRKLKPGVRPIADAAVVSPADGRVEQVGRVAEVGSLLIKNRYYRVAELIGSAAGAERFRGGSFAVIYLSPADYHRVHAPVSGHISLVRGMPGDLYPVNSVGERHVPGLFARNQRVALSIDTEALGRVVVVMVGAMIVGRISVTALGGSCTRPGLHRLEPARPVQAGDELGVFHLGSTAVLFLEPGVDLSRDFGPIRYGEPLTSR